MRETWAIVGFVAILIGCLITWDRQMAEQAKPPPLHDAFVRLNRNGGVVAEIGEKHWPLSALSAKCCHSVRKTIPRGCNGTIVIDEPCPFWLTLTPFGFVISFACAEIQAANSIRKVRIPVYRAEDVGFCLGHMIATGTPAYSNRNTAARVFLLTRSFDYREQRVVCSRGISELMLTSIDDQVDLLSHSYGMPIYRRTGRWAATADFDRAELFDSCRNGDRELESQCRVESDGTIVIQ